MNTKTKKSTDSTTMLHLRMERSLHNDVKSLANAMGVSVSLVGEVLFKKFIEEKSLTLNTSYTPNKQLKAILDEAKENRDNSKYWTSNKSVKSLMASLEK